MSMGKQNLEGDKKCICVSYLDLNFTLLLALMQFCTMMLKPQFSPKVDLSGFGIKLSNLVY